MWVYTEYGQKYAEECGHRDRKAGEPALLGYCFVDGVIAKEWEKKGYIRWEEAHQNESEKFKEGDLIIYRNGDRYEIGKIKRLTDNGAFVWYHEGSTAAKTPYDCMHKLINGYTIKETTLGGERSA